MNENANPEAGRYQIVAIGKNEAVLLDTATGSSWSLARDIDSLQLGWKPLEELWPDPVLRHAPEQLPKFPGHAVTETSVAWWKPRLRAKWARVRQPSA